MRPKNRLSKLKKRLETAARENGTEAQFRRVQYGNIFSGRAGRWGLVVQGHDTKYLAAEIVRYPAGGELIVEIYDSPISLKIAKSVEGYVKGVVYRSSTLDSRGMTRLLKD